MKLVITKKNPPFCSAYYKGKWVGILLFFIPDSAQEFHSARTPNLEESAGSKARESISGSIKEFIVPCVMPKKELKELCKRNGIPLSWVTDKFPKKTRKNKGIRRREKRKCRPLTPDEFRRFLQHLNRLDKTSGLVAKILWFLNRQLKQVGDFVTLEELLRLRIEEIAPKNDLEPYWIELRRSGFNGCSMIVHFLPKYLCRKCHNLGYFSQLISPFNRKRLSIKSTIEDEDVCVFSPTNARVSWGALGLFSYNLVMT